MKLIVQTNRLLSELQTPVAVEDILLVASCLWTPWRRNFLSDLQVSRARVYIGSAGMMELKLFK